MAGIMYAMVLLIRSMQDLFCTNGDWYYVQNGKIDWTFNGWTEYNGSRYYVTNGYLNWNNQPAE